MGNRKHLTRGLFLLAIVVLFLGIAVGTGTGCLVRKFTGIPCPGCGLSRAWFAVLRLDLGAAFRYHPMFWSVPVFLAFVLCNGRLLPNPKRNAILLYILVAAYLGCYVIRLFGFLGGI